MKKKKLLPMIGGAAAVVLALGCLGGYSIWHYQQPKFHDLTIELGQPLPPVEDCRYHRTDSEAAGYYC